MSGSWWSKVRNFFSATDEYRVNGSSAADSATNITEVHNNVSEMRRGVAAQPRRRNNKLEIVLFNSEDYNDDVAMTNAIAIALHDNKTVIVNVSKCEKGMRSRIVDFASGMVFMVDGACNQIDTYMYMFTTGDCRFSVCKPHDDDLDASDYEYSDYRRTGYSSGVRSRGDYV